MSEAYHCPLCNKDHTFNDICPRISSRIESFKKKKSKDKIYIWGNIILACLKKDIDFREILYEIEILESVLQSRTLSSFHDVDLIPDYYSAALNISKKSLFKSAEITLKGLMQYLRSNFDSDYEKDKNGNVVSITLNVSLSQNKVDISGNNDELYILKEKQDGSWKYSLVYNPSFNARFIELGENTVKFDFLSLGGSGIIIAEDVDGMLKNYFEKNCLLSWKDTAEQSGFDDARFDKWIKLLIQQTADNRIKWSLNTSSKGRNVYKTVTGQNEVILSTNNNADFNADYYHLCNESLFIREGEWGGLVFGAEYSLKYDYLREQAIDHPLAVSSPILLKLENLIKSNIAAFSGGSVVNRAAKKELTYADCIVLCRSLICHKDGHRIQPYKGIIPLLTDNGTIISYEVYVGYCKNCYRYLIFQDDYQEMRRAGIPLCRVIEEEVDEFDSSAARFTYKSESILHAMGYTVNAKDSLSAEERHKILDKCINSRLLQVHDIIEFLNWLIVTRSPSPHYESAVGLWREDMSFLGNKYGTEKIKVSSIKTRKPRKKQDD